MEDRERLKLGTFASEELVLELYPMQSQRVQEYFHEVHAQKDANCCCPENSLGDEDCIGFVGLESGMKDFVEDDFGQL